MFVKFDSNSCRCLVLLNVLSLSTLRASAATLNSDLSYSCFRAHGVILAHYANELTVSRASSNVYRAELSPAAMPGSTEPSLHLARSLGFVKCRPVFDISSKQVLPSLDKVVTCPSSGELRERSNVTCFSHELIDAWRLLCQHTESLRLLNRGLNVTIKLGDSTTTWHWLNSQWSHAVSREGCL